MISNFKDSVFVLYSDEKEKSKTYNITPDKLQDIIINMDISDIGYTLDFSGAGNEIAFDLADEVDTKTFNKVFNELVKRIDNAI